MRRSYFRAIVVAVLLLAAIPAGISLPVHAAPSYVPGVKVGDSVTYGQITLIYNHTSGVPQGLQLFNDTQSITATVTAVDLVARTVAVTQTYLLKNGTSQSMTLKGNVQTGNGNINIFIVAGGLSAGEPLTQSNSGSSSFFGFITQTVTRAYAGALRTVNGVNVGSVPQSGINSLAFYWDQSSGFLLEASESVAASTYNPQPFSIDIRVTSTNIWPGSSTPDFSLDAASQTVPFVFRGMTSSITLNLTSYNTFTATASLTTNLLNSSVANPPLIGLSSNNPAIPLGGSITSTLSFATDASTTLGLYLFTVNATAGSQHHGAEFALLVVPPDFEVIATPSSLSIAPGGVKTSTITVRALGVFTGTVDLSATGTTLVQTSLNRTSVTLTQNVVSVNSTLKVSPSPYSLPGTSTVYVYGDSSGIIGGYGSHTAYVGVTISGPDFEITTGVNSLMIPPGGTGSASITLTSFGGFAGAVGLTASSYGGFAVSLSPSVVTLSSGSTAKSTLTVSTPLDEASGFYGVDVTGVSGLLARSTYVSISVSGRDYEISADTSQVLLQPGKSVTANFTLTSLNGFAGALSLAASSFNVPIGFALNPTSVTLTPDQSTTVHLALSIPSTIHSGYYYITVFAYNDSSSRGATVEISPLQSGPPPPPTGPDFGVSAAPSSLILSRGEGASSTISFSSISGFAGSLLLTASSPFLPPPCSVNCLDSSLSTSTVVLTAGGETSSILSVHASANLAPGSYPVVVTATNGTIFHSVTVYVSVVAPDYRTFANLDSLTILQGESAAPTIIAESLDNFSGTLSLSAQVTVGYSPCFGPSCPTVSLNPATVSVSGNGTTPSSLSVTTSASTPPGSYQIIVTATNGTTSHDSYLRLEVVGPDFRVFSDNTLILTPGVSGLASINVASQNGFSGIVTITPSGAYGLNVDTTPAGVTVSAGGWVTHSISVSTLPTTVPGSYGFSVSGTDGSLVDGAFVQVIVAAPDFGVVLNETDLTVQAGGSTKIPIIVPSYNGFSGAVGLTGSSPYSCPGPSCPTTSFNPSTVTVASGGWSASNVTISFPAGAVPGSYLVLVNGTSGSVSHIENLYIQIPAPPPSLLSVAVGTDGVLYYSRFVSSWSSWQNLGGGSNSPPAVCSSGPGSAEVVVRGTDNVIYHKSFVNGVLASAWDSPGGGTSDQPACAVLNNVLYVVVRGTNDRLYFSSRTLPTGSWSGWVDLDGKTSSAPVLVATPFQNRFDLVVRGTDQAIYHKFFVNGFWSASWDGPGGTVLDAPAAVSDGGLVHVVVRGVDDKTYYNSFSFVSSTWSGWVGLDGGTLSTPAIALDASGTIHVVVRGTDNRVYHREMSGGIWSPSWDGLGGSTTMTPAVSVIGSDLTVVVGGTDGSIYYNTRVGPSWIGWTNLSGGKTTLPTSLSSA
ncbi:hypothetical protein E6H21_00250 [Candidatus Bathyarchaeota archaeon]|nr:MAG: hypothetical protein E6H21_00250 [Candidatus Bathyarchaeota archaeon]